MNEGLTKPLGANIADYDALRKQAEQQTNLLKQWGSAAGSLAPSQVLSPSKVPTTWLPSTTTNVPVELYDIDTGNTIKSYPNVIEYQRDTMVAEGGAQAPTYTDWATNLTSAVGNIGSSTLIGANIGGPLGALVGAGVGTAMWLGNISAVNADAYKRYAEDSERTISLLAEETTDRNGNAIVKLNPAKAATGTQASGAYTQELQKGTETPAKWDETGTRLQVDVSPAFAASDAYQDLLEYVSTTFNGLTRENDTNGETLTQLNNYIKSAENQYFYDQQEIKAFQNKYPNATMDAIDTGVANQLAGYFAKDEYLKDYKMTVYDKSNQLVEKDATVVFDEIYNMGDDKVAKDKYLGRLTAALSDPTISEDSKAIIQGQLNAIYLINSQSGSKYSGMVQKSWLDVLGEQTLAMVSINDVASLLSGGQAYGELKYFTDNEVARAVVGVGGTALNMAATMKVMDWVENGIKFVGKKGLSALGKMGNQAFGTGNKLTTATDWLITKTTQAGSISAFQEIGKNGITTHPLLEKTFTMGLDLGYQALADLTVDAAKVGIQSLAGKETDLWAEFQQDFTMDLLFTYAHTGALQAALADAGLKNMSVADLQRVIRDNSDIKVDTDTGVKTIRISFESSRPDVELKITGEQADGKLVSENGLTQKELGQALVAAHYAINNASSQMAAKIVTGLTKFKPLEKIYTTVFDNNFAIKKLGYQSLAETGNAADLIRLSNIANSNKVYSETYQDFLSTKQGSVAFDGVTKAAADFERATGSSKFTKADNAYLNAKQMLERKKVDYGEKSQEYQNAAAFYTKALNGVSKTRALALDQYAVSLTNFAKALNFFQQSEGLETSDFFDLIEKYPNYFPVFAKADTGGPFRTVEYRRTNRQSTDDSVLQQPSEMDSPTSSTMRMMRNIVANAARARQMKAIVDVAAKLGNIDILKTSDVVSDFEKLPTAELIQKYDIPKDVQTAMHKVADTEASYKKTTTQIMEKSMLSQHINDYVKAIAQLDANTGKADTSRTAYHTVEGDPLLTKKVSGYFKGMTREDIDVAFLENVRMSLDSIVSGAKRHNYKMRKYYSFESPKSVERIMVEVAEGLDSFDATSFMSRMSNELTKMMPLVTYDELVVNYVPRTIARREEVLADEDIKSGKAAYDFVNNRKVERGGAPIRIYTQGHVETYYLKGNTKADQETADSVAEVLNSQLAQPIKNGFLRVLANVSQRAAQIKRSVLSGILPSRALPNKLRDTGQAAIAMGASAVMSPTQVFKDLIATDMFSETEQAEIGTVLDRIGRQLQGYTELEVANALREGTVRQAERLSERPERPGIAEQAAARPLQRTANQLKYQFDTMVYNAKLGVKAPMELLMTPGNMMEASTRRTVGQNEAMLELVKQRQMGVDFETALANAYARGAWASRLATTDFATKGSLTSILSKATPFSYSSFSDVASKLETFVMDPVGVSSRTALYMLAYTTNLATMLASEDNRRRYMNLTEYERTHNLILPNGQGGILKIPIDEGMSGLLAPFRLFTEILAYQEPVTFWKVLGSVLDIGPLDLSGFTEGDRFNFQRGMEKAFDSYGPAVATAAYQIATGRNLYYGTDLSVDDDDLAVYGETAESAGDYTTTSNNSKTLRWLADLTNIPQWRLQQAVSVFGGRIGEYVVYTLDKLQGATENEAYGRDALEAFYKPFVSTSNNIESEFYTILDNLEEEKEKLLPQLKAKTKAMTTATGTDLAKLKNEHQELLDNFAIKVADAIQKYVSGYEMTGGITQKQAQRIYYLFDFEDDYAGVSFAEGSAGASAASKLGTQYKYQAQKLAATALADTYTSKGLYKKADGTFERETPYGMRGLQALEYNATNEYLANIENIVKRKGLQDKYNEVYNARQAIYNKGNLTSADYNKLDQLAIDWDVELMVELWPYFEKYGIDNLSKSKVVDYLDGLFFVTSDYEVDKKGRHISAPRLNKQRGFAQSFIQTIAKKIGGQ